MDLSLIISLLSGAAGGNLAGRLMPGSSLGTLGNSVAGILGGGLGGSLLSMVGMNVGDAASGGLDVMSIVGSLASGGVGGGVVMAVIGLIKGMMNKS